MFNIACILRKILMLKYVIFLFSDVTEILFFYLIVHNDSFFYFIVHNDFWMKTFSVHFVSFFLVFSHTCMEACIHHYFGHFFSSFYPIKKKKKIYLRNHIHIYSHMCIHIYSHKHIKERGSVPPLPEKTHKTVPKSAEYCKCGQNFSHFSTICISAIKPFRWMIFCMDFKLTL